MDKLKQWVVLAVAASIVIVAAGWFLAVSPKRAQAEELRVQAAEQLSANSALETQLQVLRAQAQELPKEQAKLAAVAAKIPSDPALPSLVRALLAASESSGAELVSVSPSPPQLVVAAAPVAPPAPAAGQSAPAPADAAAPTAAVPAGPVGQLANIPLAITIAGDYFELQQFVAALEELPRALRISELAITPGTSPTEPKDSAASTEDGSSLTSTISGFVYMAADQPPATAAAVPGGLVPPAGAAVDPAAAPAAPAS